MITFADAGCVVLTWGLQLFGDVWIYTAYCFPECQLLHHFLHTTGEKMFHHYWSVINSQKSSGLDNLKTITALKPFLYFLKQ